MGTNLGNAYVQIIPSASGISGSIQEVLAPEAESAGQKSGGILGSGLVTKIKGIIATAGIGKVLKETLTAGAELQQSIGGIETLFKDSFGKVKQYADDAYKTVGLSANDYMQQVTGFSASLLQSLGGDTDKAAEIAHMAMVDMADNANKMDTDMQSIQYAYQGFAKQNYTMLDNLKLGYGGTQAEMQRLLDDAEKISGVHYDMSNLNEVYEAIHVIQGELGITGTTAKEASETFSGSFSAMKAAVSNLLGNMSLGEDIRPSLEQLKETIHTFLFGNLIPMLANIIMSIPSLLVGLGQVGIDIVTTVLDAITSQGPIMFAKGGEALLNFINGILTNLPQMITVGTQTINEYLNKITSMLPTILLKGGEILLKLVQGIIAHLPDIISSAINAVSSFLKTITQNLPQILQTGIEMLGKLAAGLIKAIPDLVSKIPQIIKSIIDVFTNTDWLSVGKNIIKGIADGLKNAGHMLWDAVKGVLGNFKDKVLSFFGIHSPSRWGMFVGEMVDEGIAKGLEDTKPIDKAVEEVKSAVSTPFTAKGVLNASVDTSTLRVDTRDSEILLLLKQLISSDREIVINLNDREMARAMREMGVAFA